jgi:CDP-glucose 4,6-dehydratase
MHFLITGHTGFKGSWLSLLLQAQGHTVSGISLEPNLQSFYAKGSLHKIFQSDLRVDIRNREEISVAISKVDPDVIVHLAAQPLVRESYRNPIETFDVNVLGTLNVLEATKKLRSLKAVLIITTDKVYKNHNYSRGYVETDELGGDDPYSASKAAADISAQSWIKCFATVPIAIARAGNVIGGGDWSKDRIIPDLVDAYSIGRIPTIRYPDAIRPWQHVLDCLNGYLRLIDKQVQDGWGGAWNFGPLHPEKHSVSVLVDTFAAQWGLVTEQSWLRESTTQPQETQHLLLNSTKSSSKLGWSEKLNFAESVAWTVEWYKNALTHDCLEQSQHQVNSFLTK